MNILEFLVRVGEIEALPIDDPARELLKKLKIDVGRVGVRVAEE